MQVTEWYALCQSLNISPKVERVLQKNKRLRFDLICASIGETDVLLRKLKRLGRSRHWYVRPHISWWRRRNDSRLYDVSKRWRTERHRLFESLYSLDAAMNPTGEQGLSSALPVPDIPLGQVDERTNAQLICHLLGGGFRETDASMDSMARRSRKTWLYGDHVEADGTQSLYGSGGRRPKFIQVATYLQKVIPHRQSYVCRLVKGASAEMDIVRLEPTPVRLWQGHRSAIELH
jgi:hypothetical protein